MGSFIREYFPAFTHRNYKLFWIGQCISLIGTWMQNAALNWLVYAMTRDGFLSGLMTAVQFTPLFVFSLFAGLIIERYPKRKILIFTQLMLLIIALIFFVLIYFNLLSYPVILILLFFVGTVQALDNPTRQSFVVELVEGKKHLLNAIALNSAAFNSARLIGPAVAGKVMADLGVKWCFLLNAVSFIAVIIGLFMMKMKDIPSREKIKDPKKEIKEGLKYIKTNPKLFYTMISLVIIPTFCMNFNVLIPIYTKDYLMMEEKAYGILLSSVGFGALIGAIFVATRGSRQRTLYFQLCGSFGLSVFLIVIGFIKSYNLSILILILLGLFMILFNTTSNSILQFNSPDDMRGRIMSVYSLVFGGLTPLGSIYAGTLAKYFGANNVFIISGIIGFIGFFILFTRRRSLV
ncbi:Predicted arabinose efflux permease, MFS family [Caloramator proteoclasticus DSM 10124]|uniref:Predicted arabinose efflux permease, MFS family n=1 Tax=Caloramator proteoclasticus DSM 10124 TaxID=1121262 RepID=A0A1M5BAK9_9CLOT|nr:Predicted arabinose efflux permease, MFS family [Caloramator proteoclasticus DSM 10124]